MLFEDSQSLKKFIILSFCPIPNVLIFFYYIFSFKVIIGEGDLDNHYCSDIQVFNIQCVLFMILVNLYLVGQLFTDYDRLFINSISYGLIIQIFYYVFLIYLIIYGTSKLMVSSKCREETGNIYVLGVINYIIIVLVCSIINLLLVYYTFYLSKTQVYPVNNI
jgi:hypothetical protein